MAVQWVHLEAGRVLVASDEGAWLRQAELDGLAFSGPMPPGTDSSAEATGQLLDGAIIAAERSLKFPPPRTMTSRRWAYDLATQWYVSHHSAIALDIAVERYAQDGRDDLYAFASRRAAEERGHEQFPLDDLRLLGYDAEAVIGDVPPAPGAVALVDYGYRCARGAHPVEFLGYVHSSERDVTRLTEEWFATLRGALGGVEAYSGVREHATELDVDHVNESVAFFASLPADDRTRIALACYQATLIRQRPRTGQRPSGKQLDAWLSRFQSNLCSAAGVEQSDHQGAQL